MTKVNLAAAAALAAGLAFSPPAAMAQETMELNMATPWAGGHWFEFGAKRYAELAEQLTDGRIKINVFPAGALGPALKVTETVQTGRCRRRPCLARLRLGRGPYRRDLLGLARRAEPGRDDDVDLQRQRRQALERVAHGEVRRRLDPLAARRKPRSSCTRTSR